MRQAAGGEQGEPVGARTVVAHVRDLLFSSRIAETARRLGYPFQVARSLDDLRAALKHDPGLILVDLTASSLDLDAAFQAIEAAGHPAPVLGWTAHVQWKATKPYHGRCDRVVTRETLTAELPKLLRDYVEAESPSERGRGAQAP